MGINTVGAGAKTVTSVCLFGLFNDRQNNLKATLITRFWMDLTLLVVPKPVECPANNFTSSNNCMNNTLTESSTLAWLSDWLVWCQSQRTCVRCRSLAWWSCDTAAICSFTSSVCGSWGRSWQNQTCNQASRATELLSSVLPQLWRIRWKDKPILCLDCLI